MNNNNIGQSNSDSLGKTRAELDAGFKAYRTSLKADYRLIKDKAFFEEAKKEIGYHAHMTGSKGENKG
jgi:hypothetical protein